MREKANTFDAYYLPTISNKIQINHHLWPVSREKYKEKS